VTSDVFRESAVGQVLNKVFEPVLAFHNYMLTLSDETLYALIVVCVVLLVITSRYEAKAARLEAKAKLKASKKAAKKTGLTVVDRSSEAVAVL